MFENISGYVHHAFGTLCVMPTRQTYFPEPMGAEVQLITDRMLTFLPRLSSFVKWVTRIQYGSSAADILTTIGLAQPVRDFNFLLFIGGWRSRYGWPGSGCTWFQFLTVHRRLTFPLRLAWLSQYVIFNFLPFICGWHSHYVAWLREYVISISYRSSAADFLTTIGLAQMVRDFNLFWSLGGWHSHCDRPGSDRMWFQFVMVHRRLTFIAQIVSNIQTVYLLLPLSPSRFVSIFKDRESLLFLLHTVTSAHSLVAFPTSRRYANFSWSKYIWIIHRLLVPGASQFYFAL